MSAFFCRNKPLCHSIIQKISNADLIFSVLREICIFGYVLPFRFLPTHFTVPVRCHSRFFSERIGKVRLGTKTQLIPNIKERLGRIEQKAFCFKDFYVLDFSGYGFPGSLSVLAGKMASAVVEFLRKKINSQFLIRMTNYISVDFVGQR
jgi:hypothetical protein